MIKKSLKSRNLSEEKKTHPEHKYSVTFVSKVVRTIINDRNLQIKIKNVKYLLNNKKEYLKCPVSMYAKVQLSCMPNHHEKFLAIFFITIFDQFL